MISFQHGFVLMYLHAGLSHQMAYCTGRFFFRIPEAHLGNWLLSGDDDRFYNALIPGPYRVVTGLGCHATT